MRQAFKSFFSYLHFDFRLHFVNKYEHGLLNEFICVDLASTD
jgi:hypothetical protein